MRPKTQYLQLPLAFMTGSRGETQDAACEGTESSTAKRGPQSPAIGKSLIEEACVAAVVVLGLDSVNRSSGSPGFATFVTG